MRRTIARSWTTFPEVERTRTWAAFNLAILDAEGQPDFDDAGGEAAGSIDGQFFTQDRVGIVDGRMSDPDEVDELVVSEYADEVEGFDVGDHVRSRLHRRATRGRLVLRGHRPRPSTRSS